MIFVLLLMTPTLALAEPQYDLVDLGTTFNLFGVDPDGAVVGMVREQAAVVRRGEQPRLLPFLPEGVFAIAQAGRDGKLVGESGTGHLSMQTHAALWEGDNVRDLGTLGSPDLFSSATAITATQIGGFCSTAAGASVPCVWATYLSMPHALPTLGGTNGHLDAMNRHGAAVGDSDTAEGKTHATLWISGVATDLTPHAGSSNGWDINDRSTVVGTMDRHAFRWTQAGGLEDLGTLPGDIRATLAAVNNQDIAVGASIALQGPPPCPRCSTPPTSKAIRVRGTTMVDLNTLVHLPAGWTLTRAAGISEEGVIGATAVVGEEVLGQPVHAVLLVPKR
jgi:uncharacterized membrane protein